MKDIVDLIAQAVQRRADDVIFVASTGQAHDGPAGVLVPMRCAQARKGGHDITAVGVLDLLGHVLGIAGFFQQTKLVPQPLDGRTCHKNRTFQRILHLFALTARNGRDQPVFRGDRRFAGIHQQKSARAKGVFGFAGSKAGLPEQCRLLVARRTCNFDGCAKMDGVRFRIKAAGRHRRGQHTAWDVQLPQNLLIPCESVNVEQHRAAGVGVVGDVDLSARQLPDEPCFHRAKQQFARFGLFARPRHIVEDPLQLGGREIGVDDKAGLFAELLGQAARLQFVAVSTGAAALPDDGVIDRFPRLLVPDDGGLALVRDADGFDLRRPRADLVHRRKCHAQLSGPDLVRVMLDPAGFREILGKFFLRHAAHLARFVEQDAAVRGRPGIQRHDIRHNNVPFSYKTPAEANGQPFNDHLFELLARVDHRRADSRVFGDQLHHIAVLVKVLEGRFVADADRRDLAGFHFRLTADADDIAVTDAGSHAVAVALERKIRPPRRRDADIFLDVLFGQNGCAARDGPHQWDLHHLGQRRKSGGHRVFRFRVGHRHIVAHQPWHGHLQHLRDGIHRLLLALPIAFDIAGNA